MTGFDPARTADYIHIRSNAETIANASIVGRSGSVRAATIDDTEGSSRLPGCDAAYLPVAEDLLYRRRGACPFCSFLRVRFVLGTRSSEMREALEKLQQRKIIDVADIQHMALIEIRACIVRLKIRGIGNIRRRTVRSVIERVAIGVGNPDRQRLRYSAQCGLDRVVFGIGDVIDRDNIRKTAIRTHVIGAGSQQRS